MKLLIDADGLVFKAGFATDKTKYLHVTDQAMVYFEDAKTAKEAAQVGGLVWSRKDPQPLEQALLIVDSMLGDIRSRYAHENPELVVVLGGVGNFRFGIATRANYKSGRSERPKHFKAIRDHLISRWHAVLSAGEEADDLIAILATEHPGSVIVTEDKDLLQVPGRIYNYVTKEEVTVSRRDADLNFYCQVLSGDSTDNVPGVDGIGPVKARKALQDAKSGLDCWKRIVDIYQTVYGPDLGYGYAVEAAQLVFVRRREGQIWQPPAP